MLGQAYPVSTCCAVLGLPRSSYYDKARARDERPLRRAIEEIAARYPTYGSRRIKAQLERAPYRILVGRHQVRQVMGEMNLLVKRRRRRVSTTDSRHGLGRFPNLVKGIKASRPDQIWVADITYVRLPADAVYLAIVMDQFSRAIRGWNLSWSLGQELTLLSLHQALQRNPAPNIHHSDQGTQYAAKSYVQLLQTPAFNQHGCRWRAARKWLRRTGDSHH